MTYEQVRQAVYARVVAWSDYSAQTVTFENKLFTPPLATAAQTVWSRVTVQYADSIIACLGDKPHTRDLGNVVIQVFDRLNADVVNINKKADSLRLWLEYYKVGDLELLQGSKITLGADGNGFYQINLRFEFRAG